MPGKTIIITGASDGIGREAARQLHAQGHSVVVVGRSRQKTQAVAQALGAPYELADFSRLSEVRALGLRLREAYPSIGVLCHNAGGLFRRRQKTEDGFEITFQVNHLAGFLLTQLLLDTLLKSRASVLFTASVAHRLISCYRPDDLQLQRLPSVHVAYGNSKLENIMTAGELHRRYHDQGLSAASFHPGVVASHFASDARSPMRLIYGTGLRRLLRMVSVEEGADTLTWLADGQPGRDWASGGYYYRRAPERTARKARDQALAGRLWEDSLQLLAPWLDGQPGG